MYDLIGTEVMTGKGANGRYPSTLVLIAASNEQEGIGLTSAELRVRLGEKKLKIHDDLIILNRICLKVSIGCGGA